MEPLILIARDRGLRAATIVLILNGVTAASLAPYQSLLGVRQFGLSSSAYAQVLVAAMAVFVAASVLLGVLSDQRFGRREVALGTTAVTAIGLAVMSLVPGRTAFVLVHVMALPIGATLFQQIFALTRLLAARHPPGVQAGLMAAVRAAFALPWVIVLPLWSLAYGAGLGLLWVYPLLLSVTLITLWLIATAWPQTDERARGGSHGSLLAGLAEMAQPGVLWRTALLGAVVSAVALYMVILGLVMHDAGRPDGDVAIYAGVMAGLEVPLMLLVARVQALISRTRLISLGVALYGLHLVGLPLLAATPFVWVLTLPGAAGGAIILTLPIAYLQDLIAARPGAGSALMGLQRVAADGLCALAFSLGTGLAGYGLAAVIGTALALTAAGLLARLEEAR